jgi:hypothetical protein
MSKLYLSHALARGLGGRQGISDLAVLDQSHVHTHVRLQ